MSGIWAQLASIAIGAWLMAAPAAVGYTGTAATQHQIAGPIVLTIAWVACSEVTRELRWINLVMGLCLIGAPLLFPYRDAAATLNGVGAGAMVAALSMVQGAHGTRMGGGWRALRPSDSQSRPPEIRR